MPIAISYLVEKKTSIYGSTELRLLWMLMIVTISILTDWFMYLLSWMAAPSFTIFHLEASFKREMKARHQVNTLKMSTQMTCGLIHRLLDRLRLHAGMCLWCETQPVPSFRWTSSQSCCLRLGSCGGRVWACSCQAPKPPESLSHVPRTESAFFFLVLSFFPNYCLCLNTFHECYMSQMTAESLQSLETNKVWFNLNKHTLSFGRT